MYDEFERAAGVRRRPGISVLGWIGIGLVAVSLLGATGLWLGYRFVSQRVHEVTQRFEVRRPADAAPMVARAVAATLAEMGSAPAMDREDLTRAVSRALAAPGRQERAAGDDVEGFLRIRTGEGELTADLRAGEAGGSLVVRDGGGDVVIDLSADAEGGRLFVRGEGEVARVETGDRAGGPPAWVPSVDDRPVDLRRVVSGHAGDGTFGALTWWSDGGPEELVEGFRERLEDDGWTIQAEHRLTGRGEESASVVGRRPDDGRTVLLTAGQEEGRTRVVLGWGQEPSGG